MTKNFLLAALSGLITGILLIPILKNLGVSVPYATFAFPSGIALVFGLGVIFAEWLGKWMPWFFQFSKFVATGFMNAAVDFGILNILIAFFGVAAGIGYVAFKSASFIVANINSFFWNRLWVFRRAEPQSTDNASKEYVQFFVVSVIGLLINVSAAAFVVNIVGAHFGAGANAWANVGAIAGSAAGLAWNFLGYKLIVFKA